MACRPLSAAWMLKRSIFFLALFRTGTLPRAAEQLGISLSSANRMLAKLRTYWDDPLFVRSGFLMQPTTAAKRRYDKVLSLMHVLEDLRRDDELDPRTLSRTVRTACYDNAFALCIASIFADFTARMPHVRLRATQADEHLFDYLREDLLDLVFFARQGLHRRYSFCGAPHHAVRLSDAARTSSL